MMSLGVVTGGSRGLGLELVRALVDRGWVVITDARSGTELDAAVADLSGPGRVVAVVGDVTDPAHRQRLVAAAVAVGEIDLVVNNASFLGPSPQPLLLDYPLDVLRRVLEVNALAPLALIQRLAPHMRRPGGVIINVTSDAAVEAYAGWGGYGSSKAALEQLSRVLAAELPYLRVYWVDPGDMNTRMHQEAYPGEDISDRPLPEESVPGLLELIAGGRPSGRYTARATEPGS
jgi:NAD(P)-dependent dehydrogenase (short-subunit alcohol dehydrogenase family)